jgi:uncharacterized protein YdhG (YjbR/CyaY superfamily)
MAERKPTATKPAAKKPAAKRPAAKRPAAKKPAPKKQSAGFSAAEKAAMKERARELKRGKAGGEADLKAKIAEMPKADREIAKGLHELVSSVAPDLAPKTWYGMPAWADAEGKVVCFFQSAAKFKSRYATLGFSDRAKLDSGALWPTSFALTELGAAEQKKIATLLRRATA